MFNVDTIRLIKKTYKRFLSLTLICLIGVAFMMGLMSTSTIMRKSVDRYNDEKHLQDFQLYSSFGFCEEDIEALKNTEGIEYLFASKMKDFYCRKDNGDTIVARLEELQRDVNQVELYEGELPTNNKECVILINVDGKKNFKIGDHLHFYIEDEDIDDYLLNSEYKIVGFVKSPAYSTKVMGTSTLKNEELNLIVYVNNENLLSDYYSTVYLTLDGAVSKTSYTNDYDRYIKNNREIVENAASAQQDYYKDKIVEEYTNELNKAEKEFETKKAEGQAELDDAKKKLDAANIQIVSTKAQIEALEGLISNLKIKLQAYESLLESYGIDINADINAFREFVDNLEEGFLKDSINAIRETYDETVSALSKAKLSLKTGEIAYEQGLNDYAKGLATFNDEIEKAEAELKKARQELEDLPDAKWMILDRDSHYSSYMYDATCKQMGAIGLSIPLIFYLVAALVCMTTMTRLIDEQRGQIGVFRALGFTKYEITCKYLFYAFSASMIGSFIGIFVGQAIFPRVIYETWRLMYDLPRMRVYFPPLVLLFCVMAFSLLMMAVTYFVINSSMNEVPSSLLRPKAPKNAKAIFLEKFHFIWERLSFTSKITARNLLRYKTRFFMTVIGVAGCTGLLIIGFGVKDSIADVISIQFSKIFGYDYQIILENDHNLDKNLEILNNDLNNEIVADFMTYTSKVYVDNKDNLTINVQVLKPRDAGRIMGLRHTDRKSELKLSYDGAIISEKFAKNNNLKAGDYITVESANGVKADIKIEEICEMYFQHYLFISNDYYEEIFDEPIHNTNIAIKTKDYDSLIKDTRMLYDYSTIVNFSGMIQQFEVMIDALDLIIVVIIVTAGALAFVVLFNLTQVNISERMREIATLKVLGFNDNEVNSYIFNEILLLSIIGDIVGLPLGLLLHHFVMNVINMEMVMFGMNISFLSYLYSFLITILFTLIVFYFTRKPLKEIKMIESLKSVE